MGDVASNPSYFPGLIFPLLVKSGRCLQKTSCQYGREDEYLDKPSLLNIGKTAKNVIREDKLTSINWAIASFTF